VNAVFVDSSVWIDHLRGTRTPAVRRLSALLDDLDPASEADDPAELLVGDLVLAEVLRGINDDRQHAAVRATLLAFPQVTIGGTETALAAAAHYRALRRQGVAVRKVVDCLIAAWCIARGVALLHSDRDFGVFVEHRGLVTLATAR
jgi:predicted nucleic acid-binding protein